VWMGGMLETGLGRAGNVAMAAMPDFKLPGDTSASARYYHRDITEPFVLVDGRLDVPTGPGLGVNVDLAYLEEITTNVLLVRRREGRPVRVAD
ncbi:MAG TPA: enolase C-terminal domain-like protein, partial [Candidatus Dormibacteraeota bacterium]|nr:enolase C-terminal domain-like protein [Candidatus Dormibacteraeota bacterium]